MRARETIPWQCWSTGCLKKNFESLHRYDDEDWAFYRFKVNQRRSRSTSWFRSLDQGAAILFDKVLLDWLRYGTNPFRAVTTAIVIVLMFGALFGSQSHHFDAASPAAGVPAQGWSRESCVFGLMTSVSVLTAGFSGDHLRSARGWVLLPLAARRCWEPCSGACSSWRSAARSFARAGSTFLGAFRVGFGSGASSVSPSSGS